MSILRINKNKNNPYVMLNKEFLLNENLSCKAKGILAYLLALPDDWQIYIKELTKHFKDGRESISTGIKELIENKYIIRTQQKNDKGYMSGYEYIVYEYPHNEIIINKFKAKKEINESIENRSSNPETGNPFTENLFTENCTLLNNNLTKKEEEEELHSNNNINNLKNINYDAIEYYRKNIDLNIGDFEIGTINQLCNSYSIELFKKAIELSVIYNAKNLNYIQKLLFNWNKQNIKTPQDVDIYINEFKKQQEIKTEKKKKESNNNTNNTKNYNKNYNKKATPFGDYKGRNYTKEKLNELEEQLCNWDHDRFNNK